MNNSMTLASIDIGSNGGRLLIKRFENDENGNVDIKRVMFIRIPLRLGKDVFSLGKVSKERSQMMMHMMKGFKQFMLLNGVDTYRACATSAMRDAENGQKVMKRIKKETGIDIEIIEGEEEAMLLVNNLIEKTDSNVGNFAYVDVGGGSTEISLLHDGVLAESHSFNVGTLRMLSGKVSDKTIRDMKAMLTSYADKFPNTKIIGSGGNINRLYKISHNKNDDKILSTATLNELYTDLASLSIEERKTKYKLKDDRADVIVPAAEIFKTVADTLQCDSIMVPNISLADSIADGLYRKIINE